MRFHATATGSRFCPAVAVTLLVAFVAHAQSDDFNDSNDVGWTRYNPLSAFGAGAAYSFPTGAYRVLAPPSPSPELAGPARAGSLFPAQAFRRAQVEADLFGWNNSLAQSVGLVARINNLGLGTTTGYTFNYNPVSGFHQINLVVGEDAARAVSEFPFRLNPDHRYRMIFTTVGNRLLGRIYSPTNSAIPLHSVFGTDDTHEIGRSGIFVFSLNGTTGADGRFDNYSASEPARVRATILGANPAIGAQLEEAATAVVVRLADMETSIQRETIRLTVDGTEVPADHEDIGDILQLTTSGLLNLDPATPHSASIRFSDTDGEQQFSWTFGAAPAAAPQLSGAARLEGPFAAEAQATLDATAKRFSVPASGEIRFYRIVDTTARTLKSIEVVNGTAVIRFE